MRCRSLALMGVAVLALLPGCRKGKPKPPPSPWILLEHAPPEEGALGILVGPGRGQQEFLLGPLKGGKTQAVPAIACLSLATPILEDEPSAHPAVFAMVQGKALLWGPSGWGWLDLGAGRAQVNSLSEHLEAVLNSTRAAIQQRSNAEGWSLHSRWILTLAAQPVRQEPRDDAPFSAIPFPEEQLQGEGIWRAVRPQEFAPGSTAKPHPLLQLDVELAARPVAGILARPFERRGDWLQVGFPQAGTLTYLADAHGVGDSADNPALMVKWAPTPAGWVRLYKPGPLPGTALRLWSWRFLGSHE